MSSLHYEVRCPLHGSIPFNERERKIIDHAHYQRLRFISQLGFSSLVYPGATHFRFSHGLGVMKMAGLIFDHILASSTQGVLSGLPKSQIAYSRQILRFAALLHDIGHAPFSHAFEPLLPSRRVLPLPEAWYRRFDPDIQASHEDYSVAVIHALAGESSPPISAEEAQDAAALIHESIRPTPALTGDGSDPGRNLYPLLKQIVSGEIDADRMDYLRRDAHFAGVAYGYFDMERLVQALGCTATPQGLTMTLDHNALFTYENFLMTRFHMAMQVYLHKTVLLFDHFLHRSVRDGEIELDLDAGLQPFLDAREDVVMARLYGARHLPWASRIVQRRPYSRLHQLRSGAPPELGNRMQARLADAGIESIHLREERRLSNLNLEGEGPPIQVHEEVLGRINHKPLHEVSLLLEKYNQLFVIENIYCKAEDRQRGNEILRSMA